MEPYDQFHVFADGVAAVAPGLDDRFLMEDAECAGDDEQAVDRVPAQAPEQKGAAVLDDLEHRQRTTR